jgi:Periplasmic copper-binding protein (NosD)
MSRQNLTAAAILSATILTMFSATAASADQTLVVDDDGQQCGASAYGTISAALDDAVDGDTIKICPGRYDGGIHVSKSVSIVGPVDAVREVDCLHPTPSQLDDLDPSDFAVVQPLVATTEATEPLLTLDADDIELTGLVLQGVDDLTPARVPTAENPTGYTVYTPAVLTADDHSGYRIHHNLIRLNASLGLEFGSSGDTKSGVHKNCFRQNKWAVANQREQLTDADIKTNTTYATSVLAYEIGWGLAGTSGVTLKANTSKDDNIAFQVEDSRDTAIVHNTVERPLQVGVTIRAGNASLRVINNAITAGSNFIGGTGIAFRAPSSTHQQRSQDVIVESNTITGFRTAAHAGTGINVNSGSATGAMILDNLLTDNGLGGLLVNNNNTGNLIRGNIANNNFQFGIRASVSATDNTFVDNQMIGNAMDARDDTDAELGDGVQLRNTWTSNQCVFDTPTGAICGVE